MAGTGRIHLTPWRLGALALLLGIALAVPARAQTPAEMAGLARIDQAVTAGRLGVSEAARQKLFYIFDRQQLDAQWRDDEVRPVRCATLILHQIAAQRESLDPETRRLYDTYTMSAPNPGILLSSYETTHFYIEYDVTGANAVPATDVSPANGIPDYVEQTGIACENSWNTEITTLGYTAPLLTGGPSNKYRIQFETQQSYGYTTSDGGGRTKIVLHPTFVGFPPNDDPDGDVLGALHVTVAHEFKHASQYQTSAWQEGGWVELDATWAEDIVYDATNDYYNYIFSSGSPFTSPTTTLNVGSYEDCNWEHYQSERLGNGHMLNFWTRRSTNRFEPVLTTYSINLANSGLPFVDAWGEYVAWNYACGTHSAPGYGYGEASTYPTTPATTTHTTLPVATTSGSVSYLAANTRLINNTGGLTGTPQFTFTGAPAASWSVSVLMKNLAGAITRVPMPLSGGAGTLTLTGYDYAGLQWAALVIGNANTTSGTSAYTFSAQSVAALFITHNRLWDTVDMGNPYPVTAVVAPGSSTPDPGAVTLSYRVDNGSLTTVPMTPTVNPNEYTASIPPQFRGAVIDYRITAESTLNEQVTAPALPGTFNTFQVVTVFEPFETAGGWTVGDVGDNATSGAWQRVDPVGTIAQPEDDFTSAPGTVCWVTQNGTVGGADGAADVDGGKTTLMSPVFDLSAGGPYTQAVVRYRRWYSNHLGATPNTDTWRVDISNDGGTNWSNLESVTAGNNAWVLVTDDLLARFGTLNQIRLRFVAEDAGAGSLVEAGVDEFEILAIPQTFVGVGKDGLPLGLRLEAPVPNPGRNGTTLRLALPHAARVSATVRDLQGRQVRQLLAAGTLLHAGPNSLTWDGRGEGARVLPNGVYFVQANVDGARLEQRVILLH